VKVIAILIAFVLTFVGGYKYNQAQELEAQAKLKDEYDQAMKAERDRRDQISKEYEEKLAAAKGKTRVVTRTITKEVEKPIYKECKLPESGVRAINEAAKVHNEARGITEATKSLNEVAKSKNEERTKGKIRRPE
jgi:uncharacterized protein YxeA